MEVTEDLLCLFSARVTERNGSYVIEVPEREVSVGDLEAGGVYRVAMLPGAETTRPHSGESDPEPARTRERGDREPPVEEGEVLDVEIEDIGDQGDGIARVGPGYVVIVPDTDRTERVRVEITEARENMAFADVVERYDTGR